MNNGWQSLESAPKDGSYVWLWWSGRPTIGKWIDSKVFEYGELKSETKEWFSLNRAFSFMEKSQPTLWLPFPELPKD